MSINSADSVSDKKTRLLDELQNLLEKQIELTQQGDINGVEVLSKQAECLVEKIVQMKILELAEFKNQREHIQRLYRKLSLAITAQKAETGKKLNHLRKSKRMLSTYHSSLVK